MDEQLEERIARQQKIMKYRYHRALRRASMWDRDSSPRSPWSWRMSRRGWGDCKNHSSTPPSQNKPQEDEKEKSRGGHSWPAFHNDFESFKAAVDRTISRDLHGTLFGRRLRSSPTLNNSPWTSFSWIFDPQDSKTTPEPEPKGPTGSGNPNANIKNASGPSSTLSRVASTQPYAPTNRATKETTSTDLSYEYDPISGRKVPRRRDIKREEAPKPPLLQSLFSEHGVDIPVKAYNPHIVYGYGAGEKTTNVLKKSDQAEIPTPKKESTNSRAQQLRTLRASMLGNSIDTAAEFGGKYKPPEEAFGSVDEQRMRSSPGPDEDAPLFSGTTYQSKSQDILSSRAPKDPWLSREGFASEPPKTHGASVTGTSSNSPILRSSGNRTRSALDRLNSSAINIPVKTFKSNKHPSLDRINALSPNPSTPGQEPILKEESEARNEAVPTSKQLSAEFQENTDKDIDLLRASDVRAAMKSTRTTKQDVVNEKREVRAKLEADYEARGRDHKDILDVLPGNVAAATEKLSKALNNVWKHVGEHPSGVVAKTMQKMGLSTENHQKYFVANRSEGLTEKLVFKDEALSKTPSIHRKSPATTAADRTQPTAPSKEVADAMRQNELILQALRQSNEAAATKARKEDIEITGLAQDIRAAYESQYGKIDVSHRQPSTSTTVEGRLTRGETNDAKPHPLRTATVKDGVPRNLAVEQHVNSFEPTYAKIVDGVKEVRKELHEASMYVRTVQSSRPKVYWDESKPRTGTASDVQVQEISPENKPAISDSTGRSTKLELRDAATTAATNVQLASSTGEPRFTSSHVVLAYNPTTNQVDASPMSTSLAGRTSSKVDASDILANLSHPAQFLHHFSALESAGYELASGGGNLLVFQKRGSGTKPPEPAPQTDKPGAAQTEVRNKIAAEEAASQPQPGPVVSPKPEVSKEPAVVVDQVPSETEPAPGPSASMTSPPTSPRSLRKPRVKRQEDVFSATMKPIPNSSAKQGSSTSSYEPATSRDSVFQRLRRGIKRATVTIAALGAGAYVIGVVAEGLSAQEQQRRGLEEAQGQGPRKRMVMVTGQRPGVYSTESSR